MPEPAYAADLIGHEDRMYMDYVRDRAQACREEVLTLLRNWAQQQEFGAPEDAAATLRRLCELHGVPTEPTAHIEVAGSPVPVWDGNLPVDHV